MLLMLILTLHNFIDFLICGNIAVDGILCSAPLGEGDATCSDDDDKKDTLKYLNKLS